jgi:hypothetical protein
MNKFDALALPVDEPARLHLQHPTKGTALKDSDKKDAYIDLLSLDSGKAQAYERAINAKRMARRVKAMPTVEELEAEQTERLATLTLGWHLVGLNGEGLDVDFSEGAAVELYTANAMRWLREQVELFLNNRANFTKASSSNS